VSVRCLSAGLRAWLAALALGLIAACSSGSASDLRAAEEASSGHAGETAVAVFGGGCFWCMQPPYDKLDGVLSTRVGYAGGDVPNPTYRQVSAGTTGHIEVVEVRYDPARVSYERLLEVFWRNIDPVAVNRQFCDVGPMYRSAIFAQDESQRALAEASLKALAESGRFDRPIATEILGPATFWVAEDYHQDYYLKNPIRYRYYRSGCGRDRRLAELWGRD
jgi:peptide-methionine (S)-S-oxide reductase